MSAATEALSPRGWRSLWAFTGVKNPDDPPTLYVSELVAPGTVNTLPEATLTAVSEADEVTGDTITGNLDHARDAADRLAQLGIDLDQVTDQLEAEGVVKFENAWTELLDAVDASLNTHREEHRTCTLG